MDRHRARAPRGGDAGRAQRLERRIAPEDQWHSPRLLLGLACGYDVLLAHAERMQLVATPCYRAEGCGGARYRSVVLVPERSGLRSLAELRGARCAINSPTSHSGAKALRALIAPLRAGLSAGTCYFGSIEVTGSHEARLARLCGGRADVAAVDAITLALLRRHRPGALAGLRAIARTAPAPAPPLVTNRATPPDRVALLRACAARALSRPDAAAARRALQIEGLEELPLDAYRPMADAEAAADASGEPRWLSGPGITTHGFVPRRRTTPSRRFSRVWNGGGERI